MATKRYGPIKLKDKSGRDGFQISSPNGLLMVIKRIQIIKQPGVNNVISVDIEYMEEKEPKKTE